ncbi:protein-L-isoaspartate O-methyltransferase [uncultured Castellaniella sp.]|jgi:protein-L-isoaspartate(D-aspartate) O-methyltransferase|uniref:protein-L-isoaspartate O-methyltransferase family protein n=1 Tax=uncultured Castellaniella sp. TaxID=647907 RepID=UPI00262683D0|nr:protein-L-isoaspartate O-methyltransferase [uncultured Castellaniella sp.]
MNVNDISDAERARFNMVEQQIRPWNVQDERLLQAAFDLPRERFVPPQLQALAFTDTELPLVIDGIDTREHMLSPKVETKLIEELHLTPTDCVLEIGTGSGYQAALLSRLCQQVTSIEIDSRLAAFAQNNLSRSQIGNVVQETGDAHAGWGTAEYDAILITGSVPAVPDALKYQLAVGGRLVAIVGHNPIMTACRITRTSAANFETVQIFDTWTKPLRGTARSRFKF